MLVSKNAKICVTPDTNASRWNIDVALGPLALGLALGMYISYFFPVCLSLYHNAFTSLSFRALFQVIY